MDMGMAVYDKDRYRLITSALSPHISMGSCFLLAEYDCLPDHKNRHTHYITASIDHPVDWKIAAQK